MSLKAAEIVFEDKWILVVDKRSGVVVNRAQTVQGLTLQDDLAGYFGLTDGDLGIGDRAGIVHRLDRETSGLLVVAKTKGAFENLQAQFKARQVEKEYMALVHGNVTKDEGIIEGLIARVGSFGKFGVVDRRTPGGRLARTDFKVKGRYIMSGQVMAGLRSRSRLLQGETLQKSRIRYLERHATDYTLLVVYPKTGRTHQVRVHLKSLGHPLVSDLIYTPRKLLKFDLLWCPRLFLHAASLAFVHPKTRKRVELDSDLPNDLKNAILNLDRLTTKV